MKNAPKGRKNNLVIQELDDEVIIYDLEKNKAISLNRTAALIWELCDGKRDISKITDELSLILKDLVKEEVIWLAIEQLDNENLLVNFDKSQSPHFALSRRQLVKKIGFSSLVALPIVATLKAPSAVMAQSCATVAASCATDPDCCSSNCVSLPNPTAVCCVAGANFNNMAGDPRIGCSPVGNQADCDARAATACCSGTGSLGGAGTCAPFPGTVECVCN